jgi:hypothetical protein
MPSKAGANRAFYRWLTRDYRTLFPRLPERTRLFRLFVTHQDWTQGFLASPTVLGVIDTYGIELIHPMREGRSPQQIGRKGLSNHRWIVGGKLCLLLNQWGLIVGWACATASVADNTFQWLIRQFEERMIVLSDTGFHAAEGDPANLKVCPRGAWQDRLLVETVLSMLTLVCHLKKVMHRAGPISRLDSRSRWRPSMCWSSGTVYSPTRRALCLSRWLILVCKIPIMLLGLSETNTISYYGLWFQIEFNFRDAKQYWGLEDFMNVTPTGATNAANLSLFMVNVAYRLRADVHPRDPDYSVLDLKADCRGYKYVEETIQMLPEKPEPILFAKILNQVAGLGRIHVSPPSFSFS